MKPVIERILGSALRTCFTWLDRKRLPQIDGILNMPGLSASVEIIRDRWGIPHIYAGNSHDLFFTQGFIHAQDRLWQMELNRRLATGRLSELVGEVALDTDRATRTFGFNRMAKADWAEMDGVTRAIILAYIEGINAFLKAPSSGLPVEFTLLRCRPGPWKPEDSLAFARLFIWQLSAGWYGEIIRSWVIKAVGEEHAAELEIYYPEINPITLQAGIEFNRLDDNGVLRAGRGPFLKQGMGSNSWTVSGNKTTTGKPFLCNDMHLPLLLPSIWYENHLISDEFNVIGASLPGLPLVMVGHNACIAWGCTLAYTDCEDLFVERFSPEAPHSYQFCEKWLEAEVIPETIRIKGRAKPHTEKVVVTHHGPVISGVVGYPEEYIALNSMALHPCPALKAWLLLNQADNWDEFVEAMRLMEAPPLNMTYADVDGNVGYWVTGKVPIRPKGQGMVPVPGWTGECEWQGDIPFEEMPHAFNPAQHYVVTCNNRIVPANYPHFLGNIWMNGYRARRIVDFIESKAKLSAGDFRALQLDFSCIPGRAFVARLEGLQTQDADVRIALDCLHSWDGQLTPTSVGGMVYEVTRYSLVRNILEPGLGKDLTTHLMGHSFNPGLKPTHEFYGHDTVVVLRMLDKPTSWWIAQAGGKDAVLAKSLKQAVSWLRQNLGPDTGDWQWGRIHKVSFPHALALKKPLDRVFNRGPFPIGGDTDTPCQTALIPDDPYENKGWSPTYRQIVDMDDFSRSVAVHAPGQSGRVASSHYDDLIELWLNGGYHPMLWTRKEIEREAEGKLVLFPQS